MDTKIAVFKGKGIRRTLYKNEWWFVITDVVAALTDSVDPAGYIKNMRRRDEELSKGWGQIATPLVVQTGKARKDLEKKTGKRVVSAENYLAEPESRKRLERGK